MAGKLRYLMSFRARLILLWSALLLVTMAFVFAIDLRVEKHVRNDVESENRQVKDAVNSGFVDFAKAITLAQQSLNSDSYLYEFKDIPHTVQHIIVTDEKGMVMDSTLPDIVRRDPSKSDGLPNPDKPQYVPVPDRPEGVTEGETGDPVEGEVPIHGGITKTYDLPIMTTNGLHWIIIVMQEGAIINKIDEASSVLVTKTRQLSEVRIVATTLLLIITLALVAIIGGRFTRPVKELAGAARRVAAGDVDFQINITRSDELGQLASTFNEMIVGLKSKQALEEKLNQAERSAVIGRLTQGVAHEIRNPLNVLNLSIDHVSTKFAPDDLGRRKQFTGILSSIKDEIARLNRMVTDLLNYGRPPKLSVSSIDLGDLVNETMALVRPQADEQGVDLRIDRDLDDARIIGDAERLKSCLSNIAINALQAMPAGGRLTASVHKYNGMVEVKISDTGVGIKEDSLPKIFEPYFSTKQAGFGLGLAVTKKIIEEHKGSIEVHSDVDNGTTFTLKLPASVGENSEFKL
jgi:signal transduction histidine kinase